MKDWNFVFAGFGGQGILFAGKVVAYAGMAGEREVSWLPSYGPEMRGGTANCSVCLSSRPIGSPLVLEPDALVVMNNPSYDKFIDTVVPGGTVVIDRALVDRRTARTDITALYVPATRLAQENGIGKLANLIALGALWKATGFTTAEALDAAIVKVVPPSKPELVELNRRAIRIGAEAAE
ncbi:MAG: 2-oxoacid:ferredoxin oxidoreductase subunit gamma [Angelakisella sp.]|jgi:2-oxoglutarate ferredoxin oxidoreductase subunit gamma|nr:2-oxoacid:ferredoxin oxidoreductase subunit gamma [Angelakisella sp.]